MQTQAAQINPLSFNACAERVAETLHGGGRAEALDHAKDLQRNLGWDAVKLMAAADALTDKQFAARNTRVDPEA